MFKSRIILFLLLLFGINTVYGQGGMKAFGGISMLSSRDTKVTPEETLHRGFHVGLDASFAGEQMYFIVGGQFSKVPIIGSESSNFFQPEDEYTSTSVRVGLGFRLFGIGQKIAVRAKALGTFDIINNTPNSPISDPLYQKINDGHAGLIGGLGVQIGFLQLDVDYRYGVLNLYNKRPDTMLDGLAVSLGIRF